MLGNIEYLRATAHLMIGETAEAEQCIGKAESFFKDKARAVKVFALYGKLAERKRDLLTAKDAYRGGLTEAKRLDRRDEVLRNMLGLHRVAAAEGDRRTVKHLKGKIDRMLKTVPLPFEEKI